MLLYLYCICERVVGRLNLVAETGSVSGSFELLPVTIPPPLATRAPLDLAPCPGQQERVDWESIGNRIMPDTPSPDQTLFLPLGYAARGEEAARASDGGARRRLDVLEVCEVCSTWIERWRG